MDSRTLIKKLEKDGLYLASTRGSPHQFKHPSKAGRVTIPHPKKDLPIGMVRSVFRQAGLKE